jgi:alkylation response protein AidB-like acyl-CoA dehydrogenase
MNFYSDEAEWRYLFRKAIDWGSLLPLYYPKFPTADGHQSQEEVIQFYEELLSATGKWSGETIKARARELDDVGGGRLVDGHVQISEVLQKTYQEAKDLGIYGLCIDPRFGGMGAPAVIGLAVFEQMCRACVSTSTQLGFFSSIADMIERFCDEETQKKYVPMICNAEISGSMCMTEPDAGSDVGSLRTTAEKQQDGTYLLNGTKCFITNGGGGLGFVLARVKGAPKGLDGISMFFAEEWLPNAKGGASKANYRITKVEDKMGMHGSPTCEVVYENSIAKLVGKENEGFKYMLFLMNAARISVGLQGLGGIEAALSLAREYAETRKQFGKLLIELPLMKRNLQDWETERDAFRALMVDTISHFDIFQKLDQKKRHTGDLNETESLLFSKSAKVVRKRTPLVKFYGAEANATLTQRAIQVFGGYGFMREYDVERLHRDSFGALLYEGTSQIQSLMAMKDLVKSMTKNPTRFIQSLVANHPISAWMGASEFDREVKTLDYDFRKNVAGLVIRCVMPESRLGDSGLMEKLSQINEALKQGVWQRGYWQDVTRFDKLMTYAESICQGMAYLETLKVLAQHANRDSERGDLFRRYLKLVVPKLAGIFAECKV